MLKPLTAPLRNVIADERGIALPLAMIMLVTFAAMMVAFSVLANTEPTIAGNKQRSSQALAMADSGLQLALWGLNNPANAAGIPAMASGQTAASPFNGTAYTTLGGIGGFTVQVTYDPANTTTERTVTTVGWVGGKDVNNTNPHRKIQAVVQMGTIPPLDPPCVLCVAGEVQVSGNASLDARSNGCGGATPPATAVQAGQALVISGSGAVYGSGDSTPNQTSDYTNGASTTSFKYSSTSLAALKALAQANGTYYQGARTSLPASGVVFIDTTTGGDYTSSTPDSQAGSLALSGNNTFNGIVIVAGPISVSGSNTFNGLIYALNDITMSGNVTVNGGIVSENRKDSSSTNIDSSVTGSVDINYNCANIRSAGGTNLLSTAWVVKPSTYFESTGY